MHYYTDKNLMRSFIYLALFSTTVFSQNSMGIDSCRHPIKDIQDCQSDVRDLIMDGESAKLAPLLKEHGIDWFFNYEMKGGRYRFFDSAMFAEKPAFFRLIINHPGYPKAIPDRAKFLASFVSQINLNEG